MHRPSFNMAIWRQTRRKMGRYDLAEVAIQRIYYCTSGFRTIASTYFPVAFLLYREMIPDENTPYAPRPAESMNPFAEVTCTNAAIISAFALFVLSALFRSFAWQFYAVNDADVCVLMRSEVGRKSLAQGGTFEFFFVPRPFARIFS